MDNGNLFVGKIGAVYVWHKSWAAENAEDLRQWVIAGTFGYEELVEVLTSINETKVIKKWLKELMEKLPAPVAIWCLDGSVVWVGAKGASLWVVRDGVHSRLGHETTKANVDIVSGWVREGDDYFMLWGEVADLHLLSNREQFLAILESRAREDSIAGALVRRLGTVESNKEELIEEIDEDEVVINEHKNSKLRRVIRKAVSWLPRRDEVVSWHDERRDKMDSRVGRMVIRALCGLMLVMLIGVGIKGSVSERKNMLQSEIDALSGKIQAKISEGVELGGLNPIRAKAVFDEANNLLGQLEAQEGTEELVSGLRRQIAGSLSGTTGEYQTEPVIWQTLGLIRDDMKATSWNYDGEKLWIVDGVGSRLVSLETATKAPEVVLGSEDMMGIKRMVSADNSVKWLGGNKVVRIDPRNNKLVLVWNNSEWGELVDMGTFGGNAYAATEKGIWRFRLEGSELKSSQWLVDQARTQWVAPSSMAIDGSIWVANGAQIVRYVSGVRDNFQIKNLAQPILGVGDLYTDENMNNLYIFDKETTRVVVVNKESGAFVKQYSSPQLSQVLEIAVDESKGVMWWLTGGIIYEARL